jgi:hypothetical protein
VLFTIDFYEPLFKFSGAIDYFSSQLPETKNPFKKGKLRKQTRRLTEALNASLEEHAEVAVASENLADVIVDSVRADLLEILNNTGEGWNQTISDVETRLIDAIETAQITATVH